MTKTTKVKRKDAEAVTTHREMRAILEFLYRRGVSRFTALDVCLMAAAALAVYSVNDEDLSETIEAMAGMLLDHAHEHRKQLNAGAMEVSATTH